MYHSTVIVQFHEFFVTKVDKAYALSCLYQEHEKELQQQIDVRLSIPTPHVLPSYKMYVHYVKPTYVLKLT